LRYLLYCDYCGIGLRWEFDCKVLLFDFLALARC
jgi:hypothetical protein